METLLALRLVAVAFLVVANAFFVAAEFVLVSTRPTRLQQLEQQGHGAARTALRLHSQIDRVLSATQLGITLASLALGWIGENAISELIMPAFASLARGPRLALAHGIAIAVAFLIITAMHLVLGEVVPKNVALGRSSDRLVLLVARPMELFMQATHPFLRVLDAAAAAVSRLFGAESASQRHIHSPEELKMLVAAGIERGVLHEYLEGMIDSLFDLNKIMVREIMVPRPDIVSVSVDTPLDELFRVLLEHRHSRLPVYEHSPEHFIGVLRAWDVFRVWLERQTAHQAGRPVRSFKLRSLVRKPLIVPETKPLDRLLQEFKQERRHLALVVDEFGTIVGLVTIVDVLERILGDFVEQPERKGASLRSSDLGLMLDGSTHIHELQEWYEIGLPHEAGFETVAGFVMSRLGHIPRVGDSVVFKGWRFTVQEMDHHRVAVIRLDPFMLEPVTGGSEPASIS